MNHDMHASLYRRKSAGLDWSRIAFLLLLALFLIALGISHARADAASLSDHQLRQANLCSAQFSRYERKHAIPMYLLKAIALTESGRWHKASGQMIPWPWAVHAQGKGYYFNSMAEAVSAVKELQANGVSNIDVGCMQVNLYYHGQAFASVEQAFMPLKNIAYASDFLYANYRQAGSWRGAVAAYHSQTPELGTRYAAKVMERWRTTMQQALGGNAAQDIELASVESSAGPRRIRVGDGGNVSGASSYTSSKTVGHYKKSNSGQWNQASGHIAAKKLSDEKRARVVGTKHKTILVNRVAHASAENQAAAESTASQQVAVATTAGEAAAAEVFALSPEQEAALARMEQGQAQATTTTTAALDASAPLSMPPAVEAAEELEGVWQVAQVQKTIATTSAEIPAAEIPAAEIPAAQPVASSPVAPSAVAASPVQGALASPERALLAPKPQRRNGVQMIFN